MTKGIHGCSKTAAGHSQGIERKGISGPSERDHGYPLKYAFDAKSRICFTLVQVVVEGSISMNE
jgi:hypothetical protein